MKVRTKIWLGLGTVAMVGATQTPAVDDLARVPLPALLGTAHAQGEGGEGAAAEGGEGGAARFGHAPAGEGGEGGEGQGGEGGGVGMPTSYALNSTDPNAFDYDGGAQVDGYVELVHASYVAAAEEAGRMREAIAAFLADPTEDRLDAARAAWSNARVPYLQTEAFRFYDGPIEAIEGRINAWPLNEGFIDYVEGAPDSGIVNDPSVELSAESILGRDQALDEADVTTGWHAIEFLLWGQDLDAYGPGRRPATDYIAGEGNNDRRRQYLQIVTDQLVADLESLAAAWDPAGTDNYAASFRMLDQREALGRAINGIAVLAGFEMMAERLAVALDTGTQEDEHSCFSDTTHADFVYDLRGIRNVYFGDVGGHAGPGLHELAASIDPALDQRMIELLNQAEAAIADLDQPFDTGVLAQPDGSPARAQAEAAVQALADLGEGLRELGTRLGVLVLIPA